MSETNPKDPSGTQNPPASGGDDPKNDPVALAAKNEELLKEKKRLAAKANEQEAEIKRLKDAEAAREKEEAEKQGNFKKIADAEKARADEATAKLKNFEENLLEARKRSAVLRQIQGSVYPEAADRLLDVSKVAVEEDGSLNMESVKAAAQEFEKAHHYAIDRGGDGGGKLPKTPGGKPPGNKISVAEWEALPTSAEMKKRMADVDWSTQK